MTSITPLTPKSELRQTIVQLSEILDRHSKDILLVAKRCNDLKERLKQDPTNKEIQKRLKEAADTAYSFGYSEKGIKMNLLVEMECNTSLYISKGGDLEALAAAGFRDPTEQGEYLQKISELYIQDQKQVDP
jgi:hypothetical protein